MRRWYALVGIVSIAASTLVATAGAPATATPVATDDASYRFFGRVFPDPHGCVRGAPTKSPWAKGNVCAAQFVQWDEALDGLGLLEDRFPRYLQVINLHDQFGEHPAFSDEELQSAGLPTESLERDRRDLYVVKVTDRESEVPEAERKHFAYALSIHGIERAGLEGGIRAIEDLVTWAACEEDPEAAPACAAEGPFPKPILEPSESGPTAGEVLADGVIYFVFANPDGWHRGEFSEGGAFFQRYNGNGMDLNRDWPSIGYTEAQYTPFSEPETRGYGRFLTWVKDRTAERRFAGAIDLHGMVTSNSFSFTLLGAGQRDYRKNAITVDTSIRTWRDAEERLTWSPHVAPAGQCPGPLPEPFFGRTTGPMCTDQWGTVWDTISYQVTGSFGDWMDSPIGLDAVGIDNEMALSHLAPNNHFDPDIEQLHIDGNKGLIYSQISSLLFEERIRYEPGGRIGYVFDPERIRDPGGKPARDPHAELPPQRDIEHTELAGEGFEFEVDGPVDGVRNRGLTVEATFANARGVAANSFGTLVLERFGAEHAGDPEEWQEVAHYFNQSPIYLQAGARIDLNDPKPGLYRIRPNRARTTPTHYVVSFADESAYPVPDQAPYDVSRMDFFTDLNRFVAPGDPELRPIRVRGVLADPRSLDRFDSIVVADDFMPGDGWTREQRRAYARALAGFAQRGGNLVLTDGALTGLPTLGTGIPRASVFGGSFYAGYVDFNDGDGPTYATEQDGTPREGGHPLAFSVNKPGTAEGEGDVDDRRFVNRHQTVEPVPIGYYVSETGSGNDSCTIDRCDSPNWIVDQRVWEDRGGVTVGRTAVRETVEPDSASRVGVSLGEMRLGEGRVRIVGALLPEPTEQNYHPFGLASYALTYTGYQLFENLTDHERPGRGGLERVEVRVEESGTVEASRPGDGAPEAAAAGDASGAADGAAAPTGVAAAASRSVPVSASLLGVLGVLALAAGLLRGRGIGSR